MIGGVIRAKQLLGLVAGAAMLAGCAGWDSRVHGGGAGLGAVEVVARRDVVVPPGRGTTSLALRTFVPAADGGWTEVTGAVCEVLAGDFYRVTVKTPVRVVLPDLGPDAPAISASCKSSGLTGRAAVAPAFAWPAGERPNPFARILWGSGWWWGFEKSGPMGYPDLAVALQPSADVSPRREGL